MTRIVLAVLGVLLVAVGAVGAWVGQQMRTTWLPEGQWAASVEIDDPGVAVVTAPGVLEMREVPVTVTVTAADDAPVLLALGREDDVLGWVGDAEVTSVTGMDDASTLATQPVGESADPLPNPSTSDLWVETVSGEGEAVMEYAPRDGRWLLLAATDGTAPAPSEVELTWPRDVVVPTWSTPLLVAGVVLLVLGSAVLAFVVRGVLVARRSP